MKEIIIFLEEIKETGCFVFIASDTQQLRFRVEREIRKRLDNKILIESIWINDESLNLPRFIQEGAKFAEADVFFIYHRFSR